VSRIKDGLIKFLEWSLYAHGGLHFVEFGVAIYEEAYITAGFAAFGATTMMLGAWLLPDSHTH